MEKRNWIYHHCIVSKVTYGPSSVQLKSVEGDYLGYVRIGFTKEIKYEIQSRTPTYVCKVKARGCTGGGKLRTPQYI